MPSEQRCRLLAGPAAAGAQLSLVLVVLAALLLRRARERPRRDNKVFAFDVTKQFVSSGAAHFSGLAFSIAAAAAAAAAGGGGGSGGSSPQQQRRQEPSECGWYLVLFSVDTVAGSALAILLHRAAVAAAARWLERAKRSERRAARLSPPPPPPATSSTSLPKPEPPPLARFAAAVARCGNYGSPPRLDLFLPQLAEWTCAVVAARLCCGFSVLTLRAPLSAVAAGVDDAFSSSRPSVELFSVMLVGPLLMNAAQALVQDGVLRAKRGGSAAAAGRAGGGAGAGATAAAMAEEANGEGEGAELLPSPPAGSSSSASPFSHHP